MLIPRFAACMFAVGMMVLGAGAVSSQEYPNKPIRIVTSSAGGGNDFTSRLIAQGISDPLGQPMVVDNRPAVQASETVSKAAPDGYTLLVIGSSGWILPLLQKAPYDVSDFSPISLISKEVFLLAVHPSVPAKSVKELIALAKARPGELNFGNATIGGAGHLGAELFKSMAGLKIERIHYKGTAPVLAALLSGEVQMLISDVGFLLPHVKTGRLRALAVTNAQPSALAPGLPTVAASGLPGYEAGSATGIFAPAKTPSTTINRLNQEVVRLLNRADIKERFFNVGSEVVASSPEQFAAFLKLEMTRIAKVIKEAGLRVE